MGPCPLLARGKPLKDTAKGAGDGFKLTTFNCRVESCATSSTFKGAFSRRRCIVPTSDWFEWTGDLGSKTNHRFARADGRAIWFAGLWDRCTASDAGEVASFSIMTGPSAGWLTDYHTRNPVILEPDEWSAWLDPSTDAAALIAAVRPERFQLGEAA